MFPLINKPHSAHMGSKAIELLLSTDSPAQSMHYLHLYVKTKVHKKFIFCYVLPIVDDMTLSASRITHSIIKKVVVTLGFPIFMNHSCTKTILK